MTKIKSITWMTALSLLSTVNAAALECNGLQNAASSELVSYLRKNIPNQGNAECVAFAINEIGEQRYEPAVPVLTKFLEFRWPVNARQKQRLFVLEHDGKSIYPTATALEQIGKNALPAVAEALKAPVMSKQAGEVAVSVWMQIHKDEPVKGVALLKQEADKTKDPAARQRLGRAAYKALGWCSPSDEAQCKAAAETRYSKGALAHPFCFDSEAGG